MAVACRDVEAATLACDGHPPITRTTFPTCRAHYPGGSSGCACQLLPRSRGLPQMAGGSASALSLSRPAQASLTLRPAESLSRLKATFVTRLQPFRLPGRAARQLPDQSTTLRVDSSSTDDPRLRGALPLADQSAVAHTLARWRGGSRTTMKALCSASLARCGRIAVLLSSGLRVLGWRPRDGHIYEVLLTPVRLGFPNGEAKRIATGGAKISGRS
jgi:hypothetical protein